MLPALMTIPVADDALLGWMLATGKAVYQPAPTAQLSLFDDTDYLLAEHTITHVALLSAVPATPLLLALLPVAPSAVPQPVDLATLQSLGWPLAAVAPRSYVVDLQCDQPQSLPLPLASGRLKVYLRARKALDTCSICPLSELEHEHVLQPSAPSAELPAPSVERLQRVVPQASATVQAPTVRTARPAESAPAPQSEMMRAAKERLRVTFPDGTVFCDRWASTTFMQTIRKIGPERVAALGIMFCDTPLLARTYSDNKNYRASQRDLGDGWLLFTLGGGATKSLQLHDISKRLNLGLTIERGSDLQPLAPAEAAPSAQAAKAVPARAPRQEKQRLAVTFADGTRIEGPHARDTYVAVLRRIGLDKVRRVNLNIRNVSLVTTTPSAKCVQVVDEETGLYITIPGGSKLMYKYLTLLAAFTHTHLQIQLV